MRPTHARWMERGQRTQLTIAIPYADDSGPLHAMHQWRGHVTPDHTGGAAGLRAGARSRWLLVVVVVAKDGEAANSGTVC